MAENTNETVAEVQLEIKHIRSEINALYAKLSEKERRLQQLNAEVPPVTVSAESPVTKLTTADIEAYSRQLIMPDFGVKGQLKLKNSSVLIVGMGGLGCPAGQYLVAAGCGHVGLIDYDVVDRSNLHRQTLHRSYCTDMSKVVSARLALLESNPQCRIECFDLMLDSQNAMDIIPQFDVILDCTDNVATRYLLNDACVLADKPLISGSALQMDGQLTVYHYGAQGPCYRCLFPVPPPPESVTNCGDGGVLGAVTGLIGSMQALETIKLITGIGDVLAGRLLCFDGTSAQFRVIKLRPRRTNCDVCSDSPIVTQLIDYVQFCSMRPSDKEQQLNVLPIEQRIGVSDLKEMYAKAEPMLLIDVRPPNEFEICELPKSINVPIKDILNDGYLEMLKTDLSDATLPIVVVCRRGNDSQIAVEHIRNRFLERSVVDVIGGLRAYHYEIDKDFPIY